MTFVRLLFCLVIGPKAKRETERERQRGTDRQTEKERQRQRDRERQGETKTDRQTETGRQTETEAEIHFLLHDSIATTFSVVSSKRSGIRVMTTALRPLCLYKAIHLKLNRGRINCTVNLLLNRNFLVCYRVLSCPTQSEDLV